MHRIYLVEDEPKLATMLAAHLERYGYEVVIARRFDDLKLPRCQGRAGALRVRRRRSGSPYRCGE
ncbi:MAG: hypothetical protein KF875_06375 [Trueperaceae bacterium]|nr:hypothetical protein [Trueperaceae bacterium]MCO5173396.1 hypothetical protein [Trueperaceae bacterium]MCW5819231.1 hypothetical protein [Trueperaceae bacterium]